MSNSTLERGRLFRGALPAVVVAACLAVVLGTERAVSDRLVTIPAGTRVIAALTKPVSSGILRPGDTIRLKTMLPVKVGAGAVVPEGMTVTAVVARPDRAASGPRLAVRFTALEHSGRSHPIDAERFEIRGGPDGERPSTTDTSADIVIATVLGNGALVLAPDGQIELPEGQRIRIRLNEPVTIELR